MTTWGAPWMLVLLGLLPLIWWRWWRKAPHSAVRFSSIDWLKRHGRSYRTKTRNALPLLRTLSAGLLVVCLARPQKGNEETRIFSEGIAIQMVVDRSSSMQAMDFTLHGKRADRLTVVKDVFRNFVAGDGDLEGRPDDLIGMVSFARYADSSCPLTLDHSFLVQTLDDVHIAEERSEDGTAIGDGVALAVERLRDLDRRRDVVEANRVKGKIIILLTDGSNNAGDISPVKAAELAQEYGIKIYAIAAGTTGMAPVPVRDPFGGVTLQSYPVTVDEGTLKQMAGITGGRFWRATDTESLKEIYADIDQLEKTKTEEKRYMQFAELATERLRLGALSLPPLMAIVFSLLILEILLANTALRKVP